MKQKLLSFILVCTLLIGGAYAQDRRVTGTVSGENGEPLAGVSVSVVGQTFSAQTGSDGQYSVVFPQGATELDFRYVGYEGQRITVGSQGVVNVTLAVGSEAIDEVVVTGAFGITTTARATSYSAQVVSQEELNTVRQTNLNNALAGKVAGIQVRSQSAAKLGEAGDVRLRGAGGFGAGQGAIYVVDGTILPNAIDVNLDDIENVTVLQGPAAAAIFGSQGANGAIVISLKKGQSVPGLGVTVNLGTQFENPYILPDYQNLYAGGTNDTWHTYTWEPGHPEEWRALEGQRYKDTYDDVSWGPRIDGEQHIPWYSWYPGHSRSFQTAALTAQPDNIRSFYETAVVSNNGVTLRNSSEKLDLKMSYNNTYMQGLLPNSSLNRNNVNVSTVYRILPQVEVGANINYINGRVKGIMSDGYGNNGTGAFSQWINRDLDFGIMKELRDLNYNGIYASWNKPNPSQYDPENPDDFYRANYFFNPYTYFDFVDRINHNDRLFGDIFAAYTIMDGLRLRATYRKQQNTTYREDREYTELAYSHTQAGQFDRYYTHNTYSNRQNFELLASFDRTFEDFSVNANVGSDFFWATYRDNGGNTNQGLTVPNGFFLTNSVNPASQWNDRWDEQYRAVFGTATLGYKNMLFVNGTLRNDWFSTLPAQNNDVLSKSFGASFVFSDLIKEQAPWLSYGKVRYSWGEIPQALGTTSTRFGAYRYPGMNYTIGQFQWNGNILMNTPNQLVDPNIGGAVARQQEIGLDLQFFRNRLGLSATYWDGSERNFPYALSVNGASGYTSLLTNIGLITKKGAEFILSGTPVRTQDFSWNINFTYAKLIENDIVELSDEYEVTRSTGQGHVSFGQLPQVYHQKGERWGQLIGSGIMRNEDGVPILDANGYYQRQDNILYGSVLPDHTGGIQNTFTYKSFTLSANIDYQFGGKFASLSSAFGAYSGITGRTTEINDRGANVRDAIADGGGKKTVGVNADGQPVEFYVPVRNFYVNSFNNGTVDEFIFDLDFIKLREIAFGYELPVNKLNLRRLGVQNANIAIVGRNLWLIHDKTGGEFDPSEISDFAGERSQLPGTRGWGFNLRVGF